MASSNIARIKFRECIKSWIDDHESGSAPDKDDGDESAAGLALHAAAYAELREAVKDEVLCYADYGPVRSFDAACEFRHEGDYWQEYYGESRFEFRDFWEVDCTEFSHRFIWCCYALAWGIEQYDNSKIAALADVK